MNNLDKNRIRLMVKELIRNEILKLRFDYDVYLTERTVMQKECISLKRSIQKFILFKKIIARGILFKKRELYFLRKNANAHEIKKIQI